MKAWKEQPVIVVGPSSSPLTASGMPSGFIAQQHCIGCGGALSAFKKTRGDTFCGACGLVRERVGGEATRARPSPPLADLQTMSRMVLCGGRCKRAVPFGGASCCTSCKGPGGPHERGCLQSGVQAMRAAVYGGSRAELMSLVLEVASVGGLFSQAAAADAAPEQREAAAAAAAEELEALKNPALWSRALAAGVTAEQLEQAKVGADPRRAIIGHVVSKLASSPAAKLVPGARRAALFAELNGLDLPAMKARAMAAVETHSAELSAGIDSEAGAAAEEPLTVQLINAASVPIPPQTGILAIDGVIGFVNDSIGVWGASSEGAVERGSQPSVEFSSDAAAGVGSDWASAQDRAKRLQDDGLAARCADSVRTAGAYLVVPSANRRAQARSALILLFEGDDIKLRQANQSAAWETGVIDEMTQHLRAGAAGGINATDDERHAILSICCLKVGTGNVDVLSRMLSSKSGQTGRGVLGAIAGELARWCEGTGSSKTAVLCLGVLRHALTRHSTMAWMAAAMVSPQAAQQIIDREDPAGYVSTGVVRSVLRVLKHLLSGATVEVEEVGAAAVSLVLM